MGVSQDQMDEAVFKDLMARIDRQQAETRKFSEEAFELAAEARKLGADRWITPVVAVASIIAAFGGVLAAYGSLIRLSH